MPGRRYICVCIYIFIIIIIKKTPFWWVPVPLLTCILFEIRSGTWAVYLWVSHGQPSWCLLWWQPVSPFSPTWIGPHPAAEIALCFFPTTTNTLRSFTLQARSERGVKASNRWGMLPWSASLQSEICRIQALKGCADAHKVLQAQVFIHICLAWSLNSLLRKIICRGFSDFISFSVPAALQYRFRGRERKYPQKCFSLWKSSFHLLPAFQLKLS